MPKAKQPTLHPFVAGSPAHTVEVQPATYADAPTIHVTLRSPAYSFPKEFDLTEQAARELVEQIREVMPDRD